MDFATIAFTAITTLKLRTRRAAGLAKFQLMRCALNTPGRWELNTVRVARDIGLVCRENITPRQFHCRPSLEHR